MVYKCVLIKLYYCRILVSAGKHSDLSVLEDDPMHASGKTQVKILNKEQDTGVFIDAYSSIGFRMADGMRIMGPCAVFPRSVLHWNVSDIFCFIIIIVNKPKIERIILPFLALA